MKKVLLFGAMLALACCGFAGVAKADTVGTLSLTDCGSGQSGCPAATYSFTITDTSATLNITIDGGVTSTNHFITAVNLGFTQAGNISNLSLVASPTSGWTATTGSLSSGGTCGVNQGAFVCASVSPLDSLLISAGNTYTWTWNFTNSGGTFDAGSVHIGAEYGPNAGDNFKGLIVSETGATSTPEPASMLLLGLGLAGVPFLRRRRS